MAWAIISATFILLSTLKVGAEIAVQQQHILGNWKYVEGACPKEVRISELFKKQYTVIANTIDPEVKVVFDCCPGYKKVFDSICEPFCEKPCRNGKCVGPNKCKCFSGFVKTLGDDCVTTCPFECLNGHCDESGGCACNPGFQLDSTKNFCVPICTQDCGLNGNCTAPSYCGCNKGYARNPFTEQCEPVCDPPCGSGICAAPGLCQCDTGFRLIDKTCQANCTRGCENGRCVANEVCRCDVGWSLHWQGNKCEPVCQRACRNSVCVGPDTCKCIKGYKKVAEGSHVCDPQCEPNCIHGYCVAPNVCRCKNGYYLGFSEYHCKRIRVRMPGIKIRFPKNKPSGPKSSEKISPPKTDEKEEELPSTPTPE